MENDYDFLHENEEALLKEQEEILEADPEIPDVYWKEEILLIENPILRGKEIEDAKELLKDSQNPS
jgi:hypothetical protein